MRDSTLQVKRNQQFFEVSVDGQIRKWADVTATPIVG
jgi:hypothetical protein